jgi:hypothetical protein
MTPLPDKVIRLYVMNCDLIADFIQQAFVTTIESVNDWSAIAFAHFVPSI